MQYFNRSKYDFNEGILRKLESGSATAYGGVIDTNADIVYKYQFKVLQNNGPIVIGIDESDRKYINKGFNVQKDTTNYSITMDRNSIQLDEITMIINCKSWTICWFINDKKYKEISFDGLNKEYRVAVVIFSKEAAIQLSNSTMFTHSEQLYHRVDLEYQQNDEPKVFSFSSFYSW